MISPSWLGDLAFLMECKSRKVLLVSWMLKPSNFGGLQDRLAIDARGSGLRESGS